MATRLPHKHRKRRCTYHQQRSALPHKQPDQSERHCRNQSADNNRGNQKDNKIVHIALFWWVNGTSTSGAIVAERFCCTASAIADFLLQTGPSASHPRRTSTRGGNRHSRMRRNRRHRDLKAEISSDTNRNADGDFHEAAASIHPRAFPSTVVRHVLRSARSASTMR